MWTHRREWQGMQRIGLLLLVGWGIGLGWLAPAGAQETKLSRKERQLVRTVEEEVQRAAKLFTAGKFEDCAKVYQDAVNQLGEVTEASSPGLLKELEPLHAKLVKAQELLKEKGEAVAPPPPLPRGKDAEISFTKDVAPILVAKCGGCHVNNQRGQFGMATYKALMSSGQVVANDPVESRLIQVIDTGEMPKGGGKVEEAELKLLRDWVTAGAKSDADENANLRTLGAAGVEAPPEMERPQLVKATGKETVSFSRDIAPILVENCSGCHVDVRQPRANLNLGIFSGLLRGGDSGAILLGGKEADSLIIKKLLGTGGGNRMPLGRPPLAQEKIALISKWIAEGATFDGGDANQPIRLIAARSRAAGLSHAELSRERLASARKTWNTFNPGRKVEVVEREDFNLLADAPRETLDAYAERVEKLVTELKRAQKSGGNEPLVKGKVSVLIVTERYDLDEYGNMVLGHEVPASVQSHWQFNQVDAHVIMLLRAAEDGKMFEPELARNIAAVAQASRVVDGPRWFADGMGYSLAAKVYSRSDEVAAWEAEATAAAGRMSQPSDFISGKLPEDQAGLIAYAFLNRLRASGQRFGKLLGALEKGSAFEAAFQEAFGQTPAEFLQSAPSSRR
ncbi:MAG: c-type cytochrome domain-containing protein [Planctomycetota bacterium]